MPHRVRFSIPERELGTADATFKIERNGAMLGTLKISRGTIVWVPSGNSYGHKMSWNKSQEMMTTHGKRETSITVGFRLRSAPSRTR